MINLSSPLLYKQLMQTLHPNERNDQRPNATNPSKNPDMCFPSLCKDKTQETSTKTEGL